MMNMSGWLKIKGNNLWSCLKLGELSIDEDVMAWKWKWKWCRIMR